jgi:biopolymer transport protein ExbD
MAGVDVQSGAPSGRRAVDGEINMIPMIDLLVCCISFLLITAVWSQMARVHTSAEHPGAESPDPVTTRAPDAVLHVDARADGAFALRWQQGKTVIRSVDVPRLAVDAEQGKVRRYPDLASAIAREWAETGSHRDAADPGRDVAVVHTGDRLPFKDLVAIIDAVYAPKRAGQGEGQRPAFSVAFATD